MTTTLREFQRNFRKIRQRAKAGEKIVVTDSDGVSYSFQARRAQRPTFGDVAGDIIGSLHSGVADLASNPKHLAGFGRDRRHR